MGIGSRLKEERERLGLTQVELAAAAGVTKKSQINWEQEVSWPNASVLAAYAAAGVDAQYVVTGLRSSAAIPAAPDEQLLLDAYRKAPAGAKQAILGAALGIQQGVVMQSTGANAVHIGSVGKGKLKIGR